LNERTVKQNGTQKAKRLIASRSVFVFEKPHENFFIFRQHFAPFIRYIVEHSKRGAAAMEVQDLYTKYYNELLTYCAAMTKSRSSAEDLVQETYLKAFTHWDDVEDLSKGQCRAWLYKTARNLYIDQIRKQVRETPTEEETLALASFEEDLSKAAVAQLIARLPTAEQSLFTLRYFEGYTSKELGELYSLPAATVRSRLASAKRRLREWILES